MIFRGVWQFLSNSAFLLLQTTIKFVRINLKFISVALSHSVIITLWLFFLFYKKKGNIND